MPTDKANHTKPSSYRLTAATLSDMDFIAAALAERDGVARTRTNAIAHAARIVRLQLEKDQEKKSRKL